MIYITGDTHIPIDINKIDTNAMLNNPKLTKDDYLIICGDFGLVWDWRGESTLEEMWKKRLSEKPFTTLFVDGNHENFDRLNSLKTELWHGGKVNYITDSIIHLKRGQVFDICDKKIFTFGGARSHDRGPSVGNTKEVEGFCWWPEELPSIEEMDEGRNNLAINDWKVDYVITHEIHLYGLESLMLKSGIPFRQDFLNSYLEDLRIGLVYDKWFCGHYHVNSQITSDTKILFDEIVRVC